MALFSGRNSNMVSRKSLNWAACSRGHSYFSSRTSNRPHGFRLAMCRSSPVEYTQHTHKIKIYTCYSHKRLTHTWIYIYMYVCMYVYVHAHTETHTWSNIIIPRCIFSLVPFHNISFNGYVDVFGAPWCSKSKML